MDFIGVGVWFASKYFRNLAVDVYKEVHYLLNGQIEKFIKKLERHGAKIEILVDGTYSKRGRDSNDCFVVIMVRLPGGERTVSTIFDLKMNSPVA